MALDLQVIREALAKATPGEWKPRTWACTEGGFAAVGPHHDTEADPDSALWCVDNGCEPGCHHDRLAQADAALIVLLRNHAAELVAEIEALRAALTKVRNTEWNLAGPANIDHAGRWYINREVHESLMATVLEALAQPTQEAPHG